MEACICCGGQVDGEPRMKIDHHPENGLEKEIEYYEAYLCLGCLRQHQQVSGVDGLSGSDIERLSS